MPVGTFVTYGDVSPRVGIYAVAKLLAHIEPITVLERFALTTPLPKNKGEVIKWRRIVPLHVSKVNVTEGVTPPPSQLVYEDVTTVIGQFGGYIQVTDKIVDLHEDRVLDDAMTALADNAASVKEAVVWGILRGGTNVFYSAGTTRSEVNAPIDLDLIRAAYNSIKRNHGKKLTKRLSASPNYATEAVAPSFVLFGHIDLEGDFRDMDGFLPVERYGNVSLIDEMNEIGKVEETRIILSPQLDPWLEAGAAVAATGMRGTTNCDVYACVVVGAESYGTVPLKGVGSIEFAVKNPKMGAEGDPLGQRGTVSWKMWFQAVRLNEQWMARIEVAATALS